MSDQRMPEVSGVELLQVSRERFPFARRVLFTAFADHEALLQAINQGQVHHLLTKPLDPQALLQTIEQLLLEYEHDWKLTQIIESLPHPDDPAPYVAERVFLSEELGQQIQQKRRALGKSQQQVAQEAKLSQKFVSRAEKGGFRTKRALLNQLLQHLQLPLLDEEPSLPTLSLPQGFVPENYVQLGSLTDEVSPLVSASTGRSAVPSAWFPTTESRSLAWVRVTEDSMRPTVESGEVVVCETKGEMDGNGLYVVRYAEQIHLRRLEQRLDGKLLLKCDNPLYAEQVWSFNETPSLAIIGRVQLLLKRPG